MTETSWTFSSRASGFERTTPLWLLWELDGDPITDNYLISEISAEDLWETWINGYGIDDRAERIFGLGAIPIHWYVQGEGTFEGAPFQDHNYLTRSIDGGEPPLSIHQAASRGDFLTYFDWPRNAETGRRLQWTRLPVIDKVWREKDLPGRSNPKGGFVQELTGWKPAPMQSYVNIRQLAAMAELPYPTRD